MTAQPTTFIGIDVSKTRLDLAVRPAGRFWRCPNAPAHFPALTAQLRECGPTLIVF